jgi:hypothetical protein
MFELPTNAPQEYKIGDLQLNISLAKHMRKKCLIYQKVTYNQKIYAMI